MPMHPDELTVDSAVVRALVDRAGFTGLPLRPLPASGSSNLLYRLGEELLVRLPRQPGGSDSILLEARWLPLVAGALPPGVAVPEVVAVGEPGAGYPEHWSVVRWIDGVTPAVPSPELAVELAAVLGALRGLDVPDAASADRTLRSYRGGPLSAIDTEIRGYLEGCRDLPELDLDVDACGRLWSEAVRLPPSASPPRWLHGDLLAENLLVRDGRLCAVLDFGGLAVGDPAVDLVAGWELLDTEGRATLRATLGVGDATWLRGRAWALAVAVMTFPYYWHTMPGRCADRLVMARAVLADAD